MDHKGKIKVDHDGNHSLYCTCQKGEDTVEMVNSALLAVAAIAHAIMTHLAAEESPTLGELLQAQPSDRECLAAAQTIGFPASLFIYDRDGVLIRESQRGRAPEKYVLVALRARTLYLSHYLTLTGHPRDRLMYDTVRNHFFRLHIPNNVHTTVKESSSCAQRRSQTKHKDNLQLFPAVVLF